MGTHHLEGRPLMFGWWKRMRQRALRERLVALDIDEEGARVQRGDGSCDELKWSELTAVEIVTTDEGPWSDDIFWLLLSGEHACVLPNSAGSEILDQLRSFDGVNTEAIISAMGWTENARFVVWKRQPRRETRV